jgi:hypothetical protein
VTRDGQAIAELRAPARHPIPAAVLVGALASIAYRATRMTSWVSSVMKS